MDGLCGAGDAPGEINARNGRKTPVGSPIIVGEVVLVVAVGFEVGPCVLAIRMVWKSDRDRATTGCFVVWGVCTAGDAT